MNEETHSRIGSQFEEILHLETKPLEKYPIYFHTLDSCKSRHICLKRSFHASRPAILASWFECYTQVNQLTIVDLLSLLEI